MDIRFTRRTALLIVCDILATFLSYYLASVLTGLVGEVFATHEIYFILRCAGSCVYLPVRCIQDVQQPLGNTPRSTMRFALSSWSALERWFPPCCCGCSASGFPIRIYFVALFLMIFFTGGVRMVFRVIRSKKRVIAATPAENQKRLRTLVVGAGETGSLAIGRMASRDPHMPGEPIIAVDDNPGKRKLRIHGVEVMGTSDDIPRLVERFDIQQIVVAIPSATLDERKRIYGICTKTNCQLRTLPNVRELRIDEINDVKLREVDVADLLGREEVVLNTRVVSGYISGKTILVTGGGGSIGSELCRQVAAVAPKCIVVFDMYENDAYMLRNEIMSQYDDIDVQVEVGSVCDEGRLRDVFEKYHPAAVFHAAAHKHVPLMEMCPREAIQNNVFGTLNAVRLADEYGVGRFIFISTDKAVNPTSVMGATKRMGEMIIQHYAQESKTVFTAVRFGNVLGSNGSVIPLFKRQIAAGGPVTVTDPNIERFFMTIPEASRLVIQAGGMANGGEIFILDMGDPVKIVDLAKSLINLSGLEVDKDIKIVYTGLREGEKMYEELLMNEENTIPPNSKGHHDFHGQRNWLRGRRAQA